MIIASIRITGYRGPQTNNLFLPPGEYTVGDFDIAAHTVPDALARYLIDTGQVTAYAVQAEAPLPGEGYTPAESAPEGSETDATPTDAPEDLLTETPDPPIPWQPLPVLDEAARQDALAELEAMTVDELRDLAARQGVELPVYRLKKADLIALLMP
jgi:hypothetical protein